MKQVLISFIIEIIEIFGLIYIATFIISMLKNIFSPEKIKNFVENKNKWIGYLTAVVMGLFTPFCSCSSIPVFIGFISAKIPIGISIAFLISSPLLSEIAVIILPTIKPNGWTLLFFYVISGTIISVIAGFLADNLNLNKEIIFEFPEQKVIAKRLNNNRISIIKYLKSAHYFSINTLKNIYPYVFISLIVGFCIQTFLNHNFIMSYMTGHKWFEVLIAAFTGIPFYANHGSLMPLIKTMIEQKIAAGTCMTFLMGATAISIPEIIMLKKLFSTKLLFLFIGYLLVAFIFIGYLLNSIG